MASIPIEVTLVDQAPAVLTLQSVFFIVSVLLSIIVLLAIFTLYRAKLHTEKMKMALQLLDRMTTERTSKALLDKAMYSANSLLTIINDRRGSALCSSGVFCLYQQAY